MKTREATQIGVTNASPRGFFAKVVKVVNVVKDFKPIVIGTVTTSFLGKVAAYTCDCIAPTKQFVYPQTICFEDKGTGYMLRLNATAVSGFNNFTSQLKHCPIKFYNFCDPSLSPGLIETFYANSSINPVAQLEYRCIPLTHCNRAVVDCVSSAVNNTISELYTLAPTSTPPESSSSPTDDDGANSHLLFLLIATGASVFVCFCLICVFVCRTKSSAPDVENQGLIEDETKKSYGTRSGRLFSGTPELPEVKATITAPRGIKASMSGDEGL